MSFLLDTDTCSDHMKRAAGLAHRFIPHMGRLSIPSIVLAELLAGAYLQANPAPRLTKIGDLLADLAVIDFDSACAERYGQLRGPLKRLGFTVAPMDLLIASVAIAYDLTLVTHNTAHFVHIPGLRLDDWLTP
jgi:tRNA(fMet)-specific endonuclease VapC